MADQKYNEINIQWFPGHMTKTIRMIEECTGMVDAVCEVLDARIPRSSHNPEIDRLIAGKSRIIVLNRIDLADPIATKKWRDYFTACGYSVIETDCKSGKGVNSFIPAVKKLLSDKIAGFEAKGQTGRPLRVLVLGVPNVGKSSFINRVAGRKAAIAGDKPGVTRGKQWINVDKGIDLLDTPGILWPKFENQEVGELLAVTNAIKAEIVDREPLAANLLYRMKLNYPDTISSRYKFNPEECETGYELLERVAAKRGFKISGGEYDLERAANTVINEYHEGKLGRLSLELPND